MQSGVVPARAGEAATAAALAALRSVNLSLGDMTFSPWGSSRYAWAQPGRGVRAAAEGKELFVGG